MPNPRGRSQFPGRRTAVSIAAAAFGLALAGCGDVHGIPVTQAATQIAQTVCPKAYGCCSQSQLANNDLAGSSESECESMTTAKFETDLQMAQASADQGRVKYDGDKLQACLNTVRSSSCETLNMTNHFTGVPGCDSFVTPLVTAGGTCSQSYECIDGWCQPPADMSGGDGTCQPHAQLGESCATATCKTGLGCETSGPDKTCVAAGALGAPCAQGVECSSGACAVPSGATTGTCAAAGGQCFYTSATGCAAAGAGRPSPGAVALLAAFVLLALRRHRRPA